MSQNQESDELCPIGYLALAWERLHGMTESDWDRLECEDLHYEDILLAQNRWIAEALRQLIAANRADLTQAEKALLARDYALVQGYLEEDEDDE